MHSVLSFKEPFDPKRADSSITRCIIHPKPFAGQEYELFPFDEAEEVGGTLFLKYAVASIEITFPLLVGKQLGTFSLPGYVLVNAANEGMIGGGGVDGKTNALGGRELIAVRKVLRQAYSKHVDIAGFPVGGVFVTRSYDLKSAPFLIHAVGPQGPHATSLGNWLLSQCYYNSCVAADVLHEERIAFPPIGTGIFHYPLDSAAESALRGIEQFFRDFPNTSIQNVALVCGVFREDQKSLYMASYEKALYRIRAQR